MILMMLLVELCVMGQITSDAKRLMFTSGPLRLCMDYQLSAFCGTLQVSENTCSSRLSLLRPLQQHWFYPNTL
jgi:hypothetical protein